MNKKNDQFNNRYIPQNSSAAKNNGSSSCLFSAILGFAVFFICNIALSFLGSIIIAKNPDPSILVPIVSTVSMTVSAIIGGIITAKRSKASLLASSLCFLATVTLAVLVATVIGLKHRESAPLWQSLLLKLPVALGGIFGAFIGSVKKKPKSLYAKYK